MKTYLITGGAGFIGSNFIHYLFEKHDDIQVINVDKLTYAGNLDNLSGISKRPNYFFYKIDICDRKSITEIFQNFDIDYVVNFAAESHVDRSIQNPEVFIKTNVLGTQVLLDVAKEFWALGNGYKSGKKFLQISTDEVYGSATEGYFTENTPLSPRSPYSASKASADLMVQAYHETFGLPVNVTRCSNNYGPYQFPEKLIPLIIQNCLMGKKIPVYGTGRNIRDWIHVKDHCEAVYHVIHYGRIGEVYNIGASNERENIEIVKRVISVMQNLLGDDPRVNHISEDLITYVEDRKGHDWRYAIDATKIKRELGWEATISFDRGIHETVSWYINNENWLMNLLKRGHVK